MDDKKEGQGGRYKGFPNGISVWGEQTSVKVPNALKPKIQETIKKWKEKKLEELKSKLEEVREDLT